MNPHPPDPDANESAIDAALRDRMRDAGEPEGRPDWQAVVARSRELRGVRSRRRVLAFATSATVVLAAGVLAVSMQLGLRHDGSPVTASQPHGVTVSGRPGSVALVLYSRAPREEFMRNADGRARGREKVSFDVFNTHLTVRLDSGEGPLPGDEESLSFVLYRDAGLEKKFGSEVMTCLYGAHRNAMCDASIQLSGGNTLSATALVSFNATQFDLVVTGSTGRYLRRAVALQETPVANHALRLSFQLS
jgi:hypothetical protein